MTKARASAQSDARDEPVATPARRWRDRQVSRLPAEQRRGEIMAAALSVLREKGWQEATLAEIARRADIVEGSVYRFFANKHDLLIAVLERWYEGMIADFDAQLAGIPGVQDRLHFMIRRHLTTIHDDPMLCNAMFREVRSSPGYADSSSAELNRRYVRRTQDVVREGMESGAFRASLPMPLVRDLIFGCIEHHTWDYLHGRGEFDVGAVADAIIDLLLHGLAADD